MSASSGLTFRLVDLNVLHVCYGHNCNKHGYLDVLITWQIGKRIAEVFFCISVRINLKLLRWSTTMPSTPTKLGKLAVLWCVPEKTPTMFSWATRSKYNFERKFQTLQMRECLFYASKITCLFYASAGPDLKAEALCSHPVRSFVRLSVRLFISLWYFENEWTDFDANCNKWSTAQGHEMIKFGRQEIKLKVKVWTPVTTPLTWFRLMTSSVLQSRNLSDCLLWADYTAAHYATIHCPY